MDIDDHSLNEGSAGGEGWGGGGVKWGQSRSTKQGEEQYFS